MSSPVCQIIYRKPARFYQCNMALLPFLSFISRNCLKITRNSRLSYHEGDMNSALLLTSSPSKVLSLSFRVVWILFLLINNVYICLYCSMLSKAASILSDCSINIIFPAI